jgi:hypothetical protein
LFHRFSIGRRESRTDVTDGKRNIAFQKNKNSRPLIDPYVLIAGKMLIPKARDSMTRSRKNTKQKSPANSHLRGILYYKSQIKL